MIAKVNFAAITATAFMKPKVLNLQFFLHLFGIIIPTLTFCLCTSTNGSATCRFFAENAAFIMLFFFVFGFIAVAAKRPYLMLYSWVYTILLCQFLKDCPKNSFYYTKLQDKENSISVANFRISDDDGLESSIDKINQLDVDLLSVSFKIENSEKIISDLSDSYPYFVDLGTYKSGERVHVLSKYKIKFSSKSDLPDAPFARGQVILNSLEGMKIEFLCFGIGQEVSEDPEKLSNSLLYVSEGFENLKNNKPFMILGDVPVHAWETQLRSFRNRMNVSDSRMDIDLKKSGKHIFFSESLRCVQYKSYENGVSGVYEIRTPKVGQINETLITISSR